MPKSKIPTANIESARAMLEALVIRQELALLKVLEVTFGGELGDRFCTSFQWHRNGLTDQVPDAIKAITVSYPGLTEYLYDCQRLGQLFAVSIDGEWCADDLDFACYLGNAKSIHVEPLMGGAGGNLLKGIMGAVLIGVGLAAGATGVLGIPGGTLILAGSSMLLSAVVGALMSRPIVKKDDSEDKRKSSYFSSSSLNAKGEIIARLYGGCTKELNGTAYPTGRRVPVLLLSSSVDYREIEEDDED